MLQISPPSLFEVILKSCFRDFIEHHVEPRVPILHPKNLIQRQVVPEPDEHWIARFSTFPQFPPGMHDSVFEFLSRYCNEFSQDEYHYTHFLYADRIIHALRKHPMGLYLPIFAYPRKSHLTVLRLKQYFGSPEFLFRLLKANKNSLRTIIFEEFDIHFDFTKVIKLLLFENVMFPKMHTVDLQDDFNVILKPEALVDQSLPQFFDFMPNLECINIGGMIVWQQLNYVGLNFIDRLPLVPIIKYDQYASKIVLLNNTMIHSFAPTVTHLCLQNVDLDKFALPIGHCTSVKHLDVSHNSYPNSRPPFMAFSPVCVLYHLIKNMKHLEVLNVSGTNLILHGENCSIDHVTQEPYRYENTPIIALRFLHKELDVLIDVGRYNHSFGFPAVPAKTVITLSNQPNKDEEANILHCANYFLENNKVITLQLVLSKIYKFYRETTNRHKLKNQAFAKLIQIWKLHETNVDIVVYITATLFYLWRTTEPTADQRITLYKLIFNTLTNANLQSRALGALYRNILILLSQNGMPTDLKMDFDYFVYKLQYHSKQPYLRGDNISHSIIIHVICTIVDYFSIEDMDKMYLQRAISELIIPVADRMTARQKPEEEENVYQESWKFLALATKKSAANCSKASHSVAYFLSKTHFSLYEHNYDLCLNILKFCKNLSVYSRYIVNPPMNPLILYDLPVIHTLSVPAKLEVGYVLAAELRHRKDDLPIVLNWVLFNSLFCMIQNTSSQAHKIEEHLEEYLMGLLKERNSPICQLWAAYVCLSGMMAEPKKHEKWLIENNAVQIVAYLKEEFRLPFLTILEEKLLSCSSNRRGSCRGISFFCVCNRDNDETLRNRPEFLTNERSS